jgi:anti-sigma-K factor RskA
VDLSCIILSGDLELYVLGMLPGDEAAKIEQLALLFPEVQEELDRITAALVDFGQSAELAPSPAVKAALMQQLQAMQEAEKAATAPVVPLQSGRYINNFETGQQAATEVPVIPMRIKPSSRRTWLAAASFIGFILALSGVIFFAAKNRQQRGEIASLQQNLKTLNRNVVTLQRDNLAVNQMVNMLQSDVYKKIKLTAVPGKPDALVQLMWNQQTKEVFINDLSLPHTPAGKQYQLWAIVDGKPVDAGMLKGTKNRIQQMKTFARADAFAITLEQQGGSPVPTMEAMYVMGGAS